jgi:hypothetical protein
MLLSQFKCITAYNIQEKIAFYPIQIVTAEELLEDFEAIKSEADLNAVRNRFTQILHQSGETLKAPIMGVRKEHQNPNRSQ